MASDGESLSIEGFKDSIRSKELLSKIGIAVTVGNEYRYYDWKSDRKDAKQGSVLKEFFTNYSKNPLDNTDNNYGFRLLSIFESSSSVCKNLTDITTTVDTTNLYRYKSILQGNKCSESLHDFATNILKLMTQTETDLIMHSMQEMGTNIQNLKEQMVQENQTQTTNIINAVKELFETNPMSQQSFKKMVEHLNSIQPAEANISYQKANLQKFDNVMDEIEKLKDMVLKSNQQKSSTNTYYISAPFGIQNSNNVTTDQPLFSSAGACIDQSDAASSNRIAKLQAEGKLFQLIFFSVDSCTALLRRLR